MSFRFLGLVPSFALLAVGAAHAQPASTGGGGSMAYPDSLPSGQIHQTLPGGRDTGSMALPQSSAGTATTRAPGTRDTGSMALPTGGGGVTTTTPAPTPTLRRRGAAAGRTPAGAAAAAQMAIQPSTAPVPYTDFGPAPAAAPMRGTAHRAPMRHAPAHRAAAHAKAPSAAATPSTATPAPGAPAAPAAK